MDDFDLDDLLAEGPPVQKKKPVQKAPSKRGGKSALDEDFYSNLASQAGEDADSEVSDVDAKQMARDLGGLDDMDADLFGEQLPKKKGSIKSGSGRSGKQTTPRRTRTPRSNSNTPRSGGNKPGSPQRVASPSSDIPTSPRGNKMKKNPSKPSSPPPQITMPKPGTAPGKMTELYKESENLKPGQVKPEDDRPRTVPKAKPKIDFGEFDEDDPLAGLDLSEDESFARRKPAAKPALKQQKSSEEPPASPPVVEPVGPTKDPQSPRRRNLYDRPPTRSGSGKEDEEESQPEPVAAKPKPAVKKKDEVIFSDEDDFLLGMEDKPVKSIEKTKPKPDDLENSQRSAKSFMDGLLGKGSATQQLETKEKKAFTLDSKYSKSEAAKEEEDDFLFGSYQPSVASGSRPGSRRSVRFQDDDLFGEDKPASRGRSQSPGGTAKVPDGMDWLDFDTDDKPASPAKTADKPTDSKPAETKSKSSPSDWLGLKESESSDEDFFRPKRTPPPSSQSGRRTQPPKAEPKKDKADDWLGLADKKSEPDKKEVGDKPVLSAKQNDDYLGLGKEVDLDDILTSRPDSPAFRGQTPPAFNKQDDRNKDLFTPPPTRGSGSSAKEESQTRQTRPTTDTRTEDGFMRGRKGAAGFSQHRTLDKEDEVDMGQAPGPPPQAKIMSQVYQQQPLKRDVTQYAGPSHNLATAEPAKEVIRKGSIVTTGPGYSQSLQDFLEEPVPMPSQQHQPQPHLPDFQQQQHLLQQQAQLQRMMQDLQSQYHTSPQTTPSIPVLGSTPFPSTPQSFNSIGGRLDDLPGSLEEAQSRIRKLEIEKHYTESLLDSTRRRYEEEIMAIEASYKNRLQILEDSNRKKETRLRNESEQLMADHLERVRKMEQEKADIASQNYKNLEEVERAKSHDMEKLKEQHRLAVAEIKREQEEMIERLKKAKNLEIEAVASAHDTSKSLTAVVEQIQNNAKDLGELQYKVDSWHRQGLDDREITLKSKDEQLRILQERLTRQEGDNENERKRLEDLIARMESQLRDQTRMLDEERWKVKQDHGRLDSQQKSLEEERRVWVEQQARERDMIERTRSAFLEEQRSSMNQINEERRALAEERTKFNIDQKMMREKMNSDSIKAAQAEAEYDVLVKSIAEERSKSSQRLQELHREEDRMDAERTRLEREKAKIDAEKDRLSDLAIQVKQKSAEVDSMSELASRSHRDGEKSLLEARQIESQHNQRLDEIQRQLQNIRNMEEHISEEKLRLAKEKKDVENLKNSSLCTNCRTPLRPGDSNLVPAHMPMTTGGLMMSPVNGMRTPMLAGNMMYHGNSGMNLSFNAIESITSSIAADRSVRMWKIEALKDKEYLEEESIFLETLKHSPYHGSQKI
ncbi:fas-binding factor 1 homolog [Haliotis cracherodii]|uniref:fas-binding factor 1 homolog n=1 Tax=Haliotis cracherodii TaxID=6455 RepID=UPI0039ED19A1